MTCVTWRMSRPHMRASVAPHFLQVPTTLSMACSQRLSPEFRKRNLKSVSTSVQQFSSQRFPIRIDRVHCQQVRRNLSFAALSITSGPLGHSNQGGDKTPRHVLHRRSAAVTAAATRAAAG
eukprot:SAG11_NODE_2444_length_3354_cov_2.476498_2_plen_121_part_00